MAFTSHRDEILTQGLWFTKGHVEEGGDDSVSVTPIAKKLFSIADRGIYSVSLFQNTETVRAFSRRVLEGPRRGRRGEKRHIRMFLSEPNAVLVQPALSCHCVLTLSTVPSLVTAWQATNRNDEKREGQILRYYTRGVCAQRIRNLKQLLKLP